MVDFLLTDRRRSDGKLAVFVMVILTTALLYFLLIALFSSLCIALMNLKLTIHWVVRKTGGQKLVAVYMTVRYSPPKFNSCFANIRLVAFAHATDVKTYGYNTLLRPIVGEMKELNRGTSNDVHGEIHIVKGTLVHFSADNLGRHQVFGYLQSFRARHFCEWCTVNRKKPITSLLNRNFD